MRIEYLFLSDLHLGEESSLLTNLKQSDGVWIPDVSRHSPVMESLLGLLAELKNKVNGGEPMGCLVLNGDTLDLALSRFREVVPMFTLFLNDIAERRIFDRIIYIPGNHDHHLWEQAREESFIDSLFQGGRSDDYFHTLGPDDPSVKSSLLNAIGEMCNAEIPIEVRYPLLELSFADHGCQFFIHHGHLHEDAYLAMSKAAEILFDRPVPTCLDTVETENFAWIDFLWSTLGRSGMVGEKAEYIYESMNGREGPGAIVNLAAGKLAVKLAEKFEIIPDTSIRIPGTHIPWTKITIPGREIYQRNWENAERAIFEEALRCLGNFIAGSFQRERQNDRETLSESTGSRLSWFLDKVLPEYLGDVYMDEHRDWRTTYIFGHTHKPFGMGCLDSPNFRNTRLFNTGGWMVESSNDRGQIYGAAMTVINSSGEVGQAQLFSQGEAEHDREFPELSGDHRVKQALSDALRGAVSDEFIREARREIAARRSEIVK